MTYAPPPQSLFGNALSVRSLAIEGWRGINHSIALVNQHQILELLKIDGLKLFHSDLPYAFPHWSRATNGSGLRPEQQAAIDAITIPGNDPVDCIYRISSPIHAGSEDERCKTVTFMVTELGLTGGSFATPGRELFFTRDNNIIVTCSRWSRERLVDWGFPEAKIATIPLGVDGTVFGPGKPGEKQARRLALGFAEDETVFLNVGLSTWNKGIDLLLIAFARLRVAGCKVRLILKDQRDLYGRSVENLIKTIGADHPALLASDTLSAIIVVPMNLGTESLRALFVVADCYVSPYRAEGFNLPVLEAIACGTPVIVPRGGATDDFCNDDVAIRIRGTAASLPLGDTGSVGRYIEPDIGELVQAMEAFTERASGGLRNFQAARGEIMTRFTWANAARQLAQITVGHEAASEGLDDRLSSSVVSVETRPATRGEVPDLIGMRLGQLSNYASGTEDQIAAGGLINVAPDGTASQSSYWHSSRPGEAANALSDQPEGDFAFHTDLEDAPWWQVDLGSSLPIEAIVVHNRVRSHRERARTLRIDIADRPEHWVLLHAGYASFGCRREGHPFELRIGSELRARYIRVSLMERQYLHLSQVQVLVRRQHAALSRFRRQHALAQFDDRSTDFGRPYGIEIPTGALCHSIVGLKTTHAGRFGNLLHQYTHMIQLARSTGLSYVQLGQHEILAVRHAFEVDGITFLPPEASLPNVGAFITGSFFDSTPFVPLLSCFLRFGPEEEAMHTEIAQRFVRPHLLTGLPVPGEQHFNDELTIHIRSGDLFVGDQAGNRAYRQPPLSFYTLVIRRMRAEGRISRVRLVFEDRGNPCIDALDAWLRAEGIAFRVQSGTLRSDLSALLDAPHLVFGYGTFGYAICRMSTRVQTLHFFAPELGGCYAHIPAISEVVRVSDREHGYIAAGEVGAASGEWSNTPEQRYAMLTYPEASLKAETVADRRSVVQ